MRRSLSELICDDLADLANFESDYIASEEAIRLMIDLYNSAKGLNIRLVHKEQFEDFLREKMESTAFSTEPGHYQFMIEVGERSQLSQRAPDTIHYCAVDLFIRPGKAPLAFVADHYRGHGGYYSEFGVIAQQLGVQFAVVGGATYQADSVHCPVFSLQHLLLTANDDSILPMLEKIIDSSSTALTELNWENLNPMYMVYSQSVNTLFKYIKDVKEREGTPDEVDSKLLATSEFSQHLQGTLYPMPKGAERGKIRNKAIKYLSAFHAGVAVTALEDVSTMYTTERLIDVCYKERYPLVHQLLCGAFQVEKEHPFITEDGLNTSHPLFELAFYHAHIIENFLEKEELKGIFADKNLLILMQKGLIDPVALFTALTERGHHLSLNKAACRNVLSNLILLKTIVESELDNKLLITSSDLIELLTAGKTKNFFQNQVLSALFEKGLVTLKLLQAISPSKIEMSVFSSLGTDGDKVEFSSGQFMSTKEKNIDEVSDSGDLLWGFGQEDDIGETVGVNDSKDMGGDDEGIMAVFDEDNHSSETETVIAGDLFTVPEVQPVSIDPHSDTKPKVNVGLLVQAMSKSVFTTSPETEADPSSVHTTRQEGIIVNL